MKLFIILSLALIFTAHLAFAQDKYTVLSSEEADQSDTIQGLKYFGWKFVIQKGVFQSSKFPLENGEWSVLSTESTERRTTNQVTYYRFTVQLGLDSGDRMIIKARYVISYRPSNGRFLISSWSYSLVQGAETEEVGIGGPYLIDIQPLNDGTSDISSVLDDAIGKTVEDAIEQGSLPDASYNLRYVYSVDTIRESPPYYTFFVSLVSSGGNYYRVRLSQTDYSVLGEGEESTQHEPTYTINPVYVSPVP